MMRKYVILLAALFPNIILYAQNPNISSRVLSLEDSIPIEFATVKLMQSDSIMIGSTLTDMNGLFSFDAALKDGMFLSISSVGCKSTDVSLPCDEVIYIESTNELPEIMVRGSKKYVKGTSRGLQVSMSGNPIAKLGNAMNAIRHLPMIDASSSGISVLGHGTPVIYINNRLVRSTSELSTLASDDISNVEIITNPSSKYGADVTSVILIRTKKLKEGFHAVAAGNVTASEKWSESAEMSLNYHTESGLTVFGDFSYGLTGFKQDRHYAEVFYSESNPNSKNRTDTYSEAKSKSQSLMADGGLNYDFGDNSIGAKYTFQRTPKNHYNGEAKSTMAYQENEEVIASLSDLYSQNSMHHVNAFGNFVLPAQIGLRIDADYVNSYRTSNSGVDENNSTSIITNSNVSKVSLWAGKIALSKKISKVEIEAGSEISYTRNNQDYMGSSTENQDFIAPETDNVKQNLYAGFASFDWTPNSKWNIYGGLRLEKTNTDFRQNEILREDLSKSYTDLLPNFGVSFNSPVRMTLFYRASVSRPGYQSLDNTYVYVTPTLWETGNSELRSTLRHKIGLNLYYKKFMLQSSFTMNKRNVASIYQHDAADHINVVRPVNLPDYNSFQLVAVQQLDFGFWHPTLQGVFYVQDLKYGSPERKYRKPLYTLSINNRFDIPRGFYAYLNIYDLGTGNQDVLYSRGSWQTSVTLNKTWKNWTFTLSANDIFNTWRQKFDTVTNTVDYSSNIKGGSRSAALSVRYNFNAAKGKYKGKTSRQDEIDRL